MAGNNQRISQMLCHVHLEKQLVTLVDLADDFPQRHWNRFHAVWTTRVGSAKFDEEPIKYLPLITLVARAFSTKLLSQQIKIPILIPMGIKYGVLISATK